MGINFQNVSYKYSKKASKEAIFNINLEIAEKDEFIFIVGHTGSGKTTLVQHLNALLLPTSGHLSINAKTIYANVKNKGLKQLRKTVGLVFQFPEYQLFEETILKDIAFGPQNFGISEQEAYKISQEMIVRVGLDKSYLSKSPFECSGGEKEE